MKLSDFRRIHKIFGATPEFEINIYKEKNDCMAWVSRPTDNNLHFVLNVYKRAKVIRQDSFKALLFHEFTHLYDDVNLQPYLIENAARKVLGWYTEAHAVDVSLMCLCGFNNIEERKRVDINEQITYCGIEMTLDEHFSLKFNEIKAKTDKNDYNGIAKPIQYYLGCWRFYSEYCTFSESDYIRLSKADYFRQYFGTSVTRISRIIRKNDLSSDALKTMVECSNRFVAMSAKKVLEYRGT